MKNRFYEQRKDFLSLDHNIQLSSCSQSALHKNVKEAMNGYISSLEKEGMNWEKWMVKMEEARGLFAKLINADIEEIAVTTSVSAAVAAVANSFSYSEKKNKIVTTEMDFPTIGHVWNAQLNRGATIDFIPAEGNMIPLESYNSIVDDSTLITSITHVTYYNGFKQDIKKIGEVVHNKGSYLLVDAYQSAGSVIIDVKEMGIDFLVAGLQKYLLGLPGIAFLYIKKEIADKLSPTVTGWFGQKNPFAFDIKNLDFANSTRRFDTGTPPIINGYAAEAALKIILANGVKEIEEYLGELSLFTIDYAHKKGLKLKSPIDITQKGSNTAIHLPNASEIEHILKGKHIIVSARNDVIRIAPHFYNSEGDIKIAIDAIADLI